MTRVPEPSSLTPSSNSGSTSLPATSTNSSSAPAARAASTRPSPSATNSLFRSRCFRAWSLRMSLSFSLWAEVIICLLLKCLLLIGNKKAACICKAAREVRMEPSRLRRGGLPGLLGKSAERLRIVHGDVREHLAIDLDAGLVQAVDELRVAHALAPRRGVDPDDPKAPEIALFVAPVAVGVPPRAHDLLVCEPVARVLAAEIAPGLLQDLLLAPLPGDGVGRAGHGLLALPRE